MFKKVKSIQKNKDIIKAKKMLHFVDKKILTKKINNI